MPNVALVSAALERAGNPNVTIHTFSQTNHLFWIARTGLRDEYMQLKEEYTPGFLDLVSGWVVEQIRKGDL